MARWRHQSGRIIVRGKNPPVFVGRWREDVKRNFLRENKKGDILIEVRKGTFQSSFDTTVALR